MITIKRCGISSCLLLLAVCVCFCGVKPRVLAQSVPKTALVYVNGEAITQGDLDFYFLSRGVSKKRQETVRRVVIERLIDRQLMRAFLKKLEANVDSKAIDLQVGKIRNLIKNQGDDPEKILAKLGMTEARLREEITLPLAWNIHFLRMVPEESIRKYFEKHRQQFDGTEVRASQILFKIPADATKQQKEDLNRKLSDLRDQISAGKISFDEAAKKYSQAASRNDGGDMGFFPFRRKMPRAITDVAFSLKVGSMSQPFETTFGLHLLMVTKVKPGELSLEDARAPVLQQLSREKWNEIVKDLRTKAKIERSIR